MKILILLVVMACNTREKEQALKENQVAAKQKKETTAASTKSANGPADFLELVDVEYDKTKMPIAPQNIILKNTSETDIQVYSGHFTWTNESGFIGTTTVRFLGADTPGFWVPAKGQNEISADFFEAEAIDKVPTRVVFKANEITFLKE